MGKNNKKPYFPRKDSAVQFDRRGSFKKSKRPNSNFEKLSEDFDTDETVYRILCPIKKIGSVIGRGGDIIKRLRDETHSKIKVDDPIPGTDERVVIIFSPSMKISREDPVNNDNDVTEEVHDEMEPHCPAQHALLKVHQRIAEDDGVFTGAAVREESNEDEMVTARILVPSNQVGCLLGKGGHVIQRLRTETGANIRILPEDHLPPCAMRSDELIQISGISAIVKKALYEVSTLLYHNPRPPMKNPVPDQGFYPHGTPMGNMPPERHPMSHRNSGFHGPPPIPWGGDVPRFPPGNATAEFSMKILCPAERIGGVIGKGGSIVKQIQHETGTRIQVEDTNQDAEERAIFVSSLDAPWHPISPTIEAVLLLQVQINAVSADGTITTRLLVPSSKVGCLLGQGGHIINEMRRRTRADIRVISKDGKPSYASPDEELVQVSGNVNVARDALTEVSSRLRMRSLEGLSGGVEPGPPVPFNGAGRPESFSDRRQPPPDMYGARGPGGYENVKGFGRDFGAQSYPAQPNPGFSNMSSSMKVKIPNSAINSVLGVGGRNISNIGQMSGAKVKLNDPQAGGSECVVEIHGSLEQMSSAQNLLEKFISSSSQNYNSHQYAQNYNASAQNYNAQPQPTTYASAVPKSDLQQQQNTYPSSLPNSNAQHNQNQNPYASAILSTRTEQYQNPYPSAMSNAKTEHQPSSYASVMPSAKSEQHQNAYASALQSAKTEHHQSPYGSAQNYTSQQQQHQSPYGSSVQNYTSQQQAQQHYGSAVQNYNPQQQSAYGSSVQNYSAQAQQQQQQPNQYATNQYASAVPNYNAYQQQQQQQQSPYGSAAQNYNAQQSEQSSYAPAVQNYDGQQQQQSSYQY